MLSDKAHSYNSYAMARYLGLICCVCFVCLCMFIILYYCFVVVLCSIVYRYLGLVCYLFALFM